MAQFKTGAQDRGLGMLDEVAGNALSEQDKIVDAGSSLTKSAIKPGPKKAGEEPTEELVQMTIYVPKSYRKKIRQIALDEERTISDIARGLFERLFEETEQ